MRSSSATSQSRREFFRAVARYGLLGALAAVAAVTGRLGSSKRQRCINQGLCGGCAVFVGCELPQALSAKQARRGG